jgi:type VI secretion system secreted protein Hcp
MAVDVFLKIDGIPGESLDDKHKGEIDVISFHWGLNNPARGPARAEDFTVVKAIDLASPSLFDACCSGDTIKEALITVAKAGGKGREDYYKIRLEEILISGLTPAAGSGDALPMEQVAFNFVKMEVEYRPQKADGSFGDWVSSSCSPRGRRGF